MTFPSSHRPKCPCPRHTSQFHRNNRDQWRTNRQPLLAFVVALFGRYCVVPFPALAPGTTWSWASNWNRPTFDPKPSHIQTFRLRSHQWLGTRLFFDPGQFVPVVARASPLCTRNGHQGKWSLGPAILIIFWFEISDKKNIYLNMLGT